jgi:hypothetical protein
VQLRKGLDDESTALRQAKRVTGTFRTMLVLAGISFCATAAVWYLLLPDQPGLAFEDGIIAALCASMILLAVIRNSRWLK